MTVGDGILRNCCHYDRNDVSVLIKYGRSGANIANTCLILSLYINVLRYAEWS